MRILSWNVGGEHRFLGTLQDGYQHEEEDQEYFLRHILDINADIVGLQETHHALAGKTMTFSEMLPRVFSIGNFFEVFTDTETAPGKGQQDHILLSKHWKVNRYEIRKLEADHYQCITDIDFV